MDLNLLRQQARKRAKIEIVQKGVTVYRKELNAHIYFSVSGIKECINQPFSKYIDKINLIISGLEEALENSEYVGYTYFQTHPKEHVVAYHYFKTEIGGVAAYFNVQLTVQNKYFLYSITETIHHDSLE